MNAFHVVSIGLIASTAINITLAILVMRLKKTPKAVPTIEAKDLLHDLTNKGQALLKVIVLDPDGLFITRTGR